MKWKKCFFDAFLDFLQVQHDIIAAVLINETKKKKNEINAGK